MNVQRPRKTLIYWLINVPFKLEATKLIGFFLHNFLRAYLSAEEPSGTTPKTSAYDQTINQYRPSFSFSDTSTQLWWTNVFSQNQDQKQNHQKTLEERTIMD